MDANFSSALPDKNPRVGSDFQVTLPPVQKEMDSTFMNKISQIDFSKRQNIFDSLAEYGQGVSIVIRKGTLVWVCADSLIGDDDSGHGSSSSGNEHGINSLKGYLSTLFKKGTKFAKRHKYFPAFLQTEIISKNLLVDFD